MAFHVPGRMPRGPRVVGEWTFGGRSPTAPLALRAEQPSGEEAAFARGTLFQAVQESSDLPPPGGDAGVARSWPSDRCGLYRRRAGHQRNRRHGSGASCGSEHGCARPAHSPQGASAAGRLRPRGGFGRGLAGGHCRGGKRHGRARGRPAPYEQRPVRGRVPAERGITAGFEERRGRDGRRGRACRPDDHASRWNDHLGAAPFRHLSSPGPRSWPRQDTGFWRSPPPKFRRERSQGPTTFTT